MSIQQHLAEALAKFDTLNARDIRILAEGIAGSEFAGVTDAALCNFTRAIVELCASIGDNYSAGRDDADGTAGDAIRAKFGVA